MTCRRRKGEVIVEADGESWTVRFVNVPQYLAGDSNSFSISLSAAGDVTIDYDDVAALDAIAGVTQGGGATTPGETDLSAGAPLSATGTTYELFTGAADPVDLDDETLTFEP
jgi:hypothetical protein